MATQKSLDERRFFGYGIYNLYPKILKRISVSKNEKILDAGCGIGKLSKYLKGFNLYGCDITENFVKQAKKEFYKEVKVADLCNLPYKDNEFDKVICIETFAFILDTEKAMKELLRVCKGEIIIVDPNFNFAGIRHFLLNNWSNFIDSLVTSKIKWTNKSFHEKIAKQFGLKLKTKYFSHAFNSIRNLWGNVLSGSVIGIFEKRTRIKNNFISEKN